MPQDSAQIEAIDDLNFRIEARDWPFARQEAAAIDRHWEKLRADKPGLFNGRVFLNFERRIETEGGRRILRGNASEVDFKAFLAWRDFGFPDPQARNCFAMAALVSADGAFMLGRMNEGTANAGQIYFPAGTPDPGDIKGAALDLEGSVARELLEETGFQSGEADFAPDWTVVFDGPRIACMKTTRLAQSAAEIEARFQNFIAGQTRPELVALHAVFSVEDLDPVRMPGFTLTYLRHALTRPAVWRRNM